MNRDPIIYIITNSYPEDRVMFSTYEFDYVLSNYDSFRILSFSKFNSSQFNKKKVVLLKLLEGLKELFFPKRIKSKKVHFKMFSHLRNKNLIESAKNIYSYLLALSILRTVEIEQKDILFSYWFTRSSLIAFYLNKLIGIRYICQGHGSDIYIYPPKNIKDVLENSDKVITVANQNKSYISNEYEIPLEKVEVFRLGVSQDFYEQIVSFKPQKLVKANREKIRFITIARYEHVKGIDLLLQAINLLAKNKVICNNVEFVVYGDGSKRESYKKYIEENNLQQYVSLNTWINRNELVSELASSDCYISPSRSEGLPVSLMEACAASLPIISTNVGSVCEVAINQYNALMSEGVEAEFISKSIEQFLNFNSEKINEMSSNSFRIFEENYILEHNLNKKYDFIKSFTFKP